MHYVYILKDINNKIYIGHTSDLKRRYAQHLKGHTRTTKIMNKPNLFYYEAYKDAVSAKNREAKLKQYGSSYAGLLKRIGLKKSQGRS